jgi:hypothetical protein
MSQTTRIYFDRIHGLLRFKLAFGTKTKLLFLRDEFLSLILIFIFLKNHQNRSYLFIFLLLFAIYAFPAVLQIGTRSKRGMDN